MSESFYTLGGPFEVAGYRALAAAISRGSTLPCPDFISTT